MNKGASQPIRSLSRGLLILKTISERGSLNIADITREVKLPYPTVCRIVHSLMNEGYIEREPSRKQYRVTGMVQTLAQGFQRDGRIVEVAREHLVELTHLLDWAIVLSTRLGSKMVVLDSTHLLSSLTFDHYFPGFTFPITDSASGRAYLAFASEQERESCFRGIRMVEGEDAQHAIELLRNSENLEQIRVAGFAKRERNTFTSPPGKNSSIAVPVFDRDAVCATLSIVVFAAAMPMEEAIKRYVPKLKEKAGAIGEALRDDEAAVRR